MSKENIIQENVESAKKMGFLRLEVIRFDSADVIATSLDPSLSLDEHELIIPTYGQGQTSVVPNPFSGSSNMMQ